MGVYTDDKRFLIIAEPKSIRYDVSIEVNNSVKDEINFIIKDNKCLA